MGERELLALLKKHLNVCVSAKPCGEGIYLEVELVFAGESVAKDKLFLDSLDVGKK